MNSNYRSNGNPGIRRSVDGFVSIPSKNPQSRTGGNYQTTSRPTQAPQYSNPQQQYRPQSNNFNQGSYNQPRSIPTPVSSGQQVNHQFNSINSGNNNHIYQNQPTQSEPKAVIPDTNSALNSSIFPQNAQYYTKNYHATEPQVQESQPEPQVNNFSHPEYISQPSQVYQKPNQEQQNYSQSHPESQAGQPVIGSGSGISGTILSSSTAVSPQHRPQNQSPENYTESYQDNRSSFQDINQVQGDLQNPKFFPSTGTKMKIRPIPNTVKYNSWFSLEWIVETVKSFFGNSYKG